MSEIEKLISQSDSGEDFVNRVMIGDCPECGSSKTGDCEHDPDIEDVTVGRCYDCGRLWCTICGGPYDPKEDGCLMCQMMEDDEEWLDAEECGLQREHLMAAEIFCYSFANYRDHLGIGNIRFEELMPNAAITLEQALEEDWPVSRVAKELETDERMAQQYLKACRDARQVVDAENPAEAFRNAVRISIEPRLRMA